MSHMDHYLTRCKKSIGLNDSNYPEKIVEPEDPRSVTDLEKENIELK